MNPLLICSIISEFIVCFQGIPLQEPPPQMPLLASGNLPTVPIVASTTNSDGSGGGNNSGGSIGSDMRQAQSHHSSGGSSHLCTTEGRSNDAARPGSIIRVTEMSTPRTSHSRNSSLDFRPTHTRSSSDLHTLSALGNHSHAAALDLRHNRTSSADLNKIVRTDLGVLFTTQGTQWIDPLRVRIVKGHHNWIAVVYAHFVTCYRQVGQGALLFLVIISYLAIFKHL